MAYPQTARRYIRTSDRGANRKPEFSIQVRVSAHLRQYFPYVDFIGDWAAGAYLSHDQAKKRKSLQSGRGWADIFIPYPMTHTLADGSEVTYHGLFIELKRDGKYAVIQKGPKKGQLSQDPQILTEAAFLERMNELGYFARFATGYEKAIEIIDRYFKVPQNEELF